MNTFMIGKILMKYYYPKTEFYSNLNREGISEKSYDQTKNI